MADISSKLPEGFKIRQLQLTDHDRLRLYMTPNNPRNVLAAVPLKTMITLYKIKHGITLAVIPSILLYVAIGVMAIGDLSINRLWIAIIWFILLGICIGVALTQREDWLRFCWVVEQQERFVAYGVLRPYKNIIYMIK